MADTVGVGEKPTFPILSQIYFLNGKRFLLEINGIGSIAYYFSARHDSDLVTKPLPKFFIKK